MVKLIYCLLLALVGAILVHIAIIFLIPRFDQPQTTKQLELLGQSLDPLVIKGEAVNPVLSGLNPFFRYRVCLYDLDNGAFQLISTGDVPFFSATLVSENGDVLYSITDRQTIDRTLNVEVRPASEQQRLSKSVSDNTAATDVVPVFVASPKGYAIVRAFVPDQSWTEIADTFLSEIVCQTGEAAN